jgi:hypothetical protein
MLWLVVGFWLLSPALLLIFWLLDVLAASIGRSEFRRGASGPDRPHPVR